MLLGQHDTLLSPLPARNVALVRCAERLLEHLFGRCISEKTTRERAPTPDRPTSPATAPAGIPCGLCADPPARLFVRPGAIPRFASLVPWPGYAARGNGLASTGSAADSALPFPYSQT